MNSAVILLALCIGQSENDLAADSAERPFHIYNAEIRDALKREATTKSPELHAQAVRELAELHGELLHDSRYSTSDTLKSYRAKIWARLVRVKKRLEADLARKTPTQPPEQLASDLQSASYVANELAEHLHAVGETVGGPTNVLALAGGRGGQPVQDHGPALVDLIERTINPDFWDTVGGPGSIFYFQPLHALVVSATAEVHDNIGGVLHGLRRAGN